MEAVISSTYPGVMTDRRDIQYVDLRLDEQNPRHDRVNSQREAIVALLANESDRKKIINLAKHLGEHGPSPIDSLIVVKEGGAYVVVEGNRRTAALKLLHNPDLAQDGSIAKTFRQIAGELGELPDALPTVVFPGREEAREWQLIRHAGEATGEGVVPWSPEAKQRFNNQPGTHAGKAVTVFDGLEVAYADDDALMQLVKKVKRDKLTTFGRLVSDPHVRDQLGITLSDGDVYHHYPVDGLKPIFKAILEDLDGAVTVSQLKSKELRRKYIGDKRSAVAFPSEDTYSSTPEPFGKPKPAPKKPPRMPPKPKPRLFSSLALENAPQRVQNLVTEIRQLDPGTYPNATALLMRAVVELMVGEAISAQDWNRDRDVADRIRRCLKAIDPSGRDNRFHAVRSGLADKNHIMSARTLNAWVHNPHFNPAPGDLQTLADNWTPFVQALDDHL